MEIEIKLDGKEVEALIRAHITKLLPVDGKIMEIHGNNKYCPIDCAWIDIEDAPGKESAE